MRPAAWLILVLALAMPALAAADDLAERGACREVTPIDADFACVEVIPPGASVWVTFDDKPLVLSPTGIPNVMPGDHILRLDRQGFAPARFGCELPDDSR